MNDNPIGILDSGVGGLSIWREIIRELPNESTIYVADSKNCPYGEKTEKEVYKLTKQIVKFLIKKNVKLIVIACNTATVSCLDKLREEFKGMPIVGTVPVVKTAAEKSKTKKIGILSTTRTAKSEYQKKLINTFTQDCKVVNWGTDKLVPFIEKGDTDSLELRKNLISELRIFKKTKIDSLALGCTHFPFLRKEIQDILGSNIQIFDSGGAIARQVRRVLTQNKTLSSNTNPNHIFYTTGEKDQFKLVVEKLLGKDIKADLANIEL